MNLPTWGQGRRIRCVVKLREPLAARLPLFSCPHAWIRAGPSWLVPRLPPSIAASISSYGLTERSDSKSSGETPRTWACGRPSPTTRPESLRQKPMRSPPPEMPSAAPVSTKRRFLTRSRGRLGDDLSSATDWLTGERECLMRRDCLPTLWGRLNDDLYTPRVPVISTRRGAGNRPANSSACPRCR